MNDFLSAAEIDALFDQANSGRPPAENSDSGPGRRTRWLRTVDFSRPSKFGIDQQRRLRRIMEVFCASAATRLSAEHRLEVELEVIDAGQFTFANAIHHGIRRIVAAAQDRVTPDATPDERALPLLRGVFGLRADRLHASVESLSLAANSGTSSGHLISPKLSLIAGPFANTEFFFNAGRAFHSNDVRGTTITIDPRTGDPVDKVPALVSAKGLEFGVRTEAVAGLQSSLALWQLKSNSELVYVGDAGTTEPQGASTRRGVEFNNRWIPVPWFLLDADIAWTHARFDNGDRIPNAIDRVASLAATVPDLGPWSASLQLRYLGPGALTEDNSVRSFSSTLANLRVSRKLGPSAELTLDVYNLFDRQVNDIQYFYESQLPGEAAPVADRHVHPAEPRSARLSLLVRF
jgi:outer membrane receptor protein involved in Fe transport